MIRMFSPRSIFVWAALGSLVSSLAFGQESSSVQQPAPPIPPAPACPVDDFRKWLSLPPAELDAALASKSPKQKASLQAKLKEYASLAEANGNAGSGWWNCTGTFVPSWNKLPKKGLTPWRLSLKASALW